MIPTPNLGVSLPDNSLSCKEIEERVNGVMGKDNEKMNTNELNRWLETEEGKKWGDEFKAPLLNKRDELLAALKDANGKIAEAEQRSTAAAGELSQEREALSALAVDKELSRVLQEKHVMEAVIPSIIAELKNSYGITVKADGPNRQAIGKVKAEDGEREASLAEIVSAWAETPAAKQVTLNTNTGGGALGSNGGAHTTHSLSKLSGPALAKLSNAEFQAMRQSALTAQGE
jgi:hypothetical protein